MWYYGPSSSNRWRKTEWTRSEQNLPVQTRASWRISSRQIVVSAQICQRTVPRISRVHNRRFVSEKICIKTILIQIFFRENSSLKKISIFSRLSHSDAVLRRYNGEIWNLGHGRSRTLSQFSPYVLQRSTNGYSRLRHYKSSKFFLQKVKNLLKMRENYRNHLQKRKHGLKSFKNKPILTLLSLWQATKQI